MRTQHRLRRAFGRESPNNIVADKPGRRLQGMLEQERNRFLLVRGRVGEKSPLGVPVIQINLFDTADHVCHMAHLPAPLPQQSVVLLLEQPVILARGAGGFDQITRDTFQVLQTQAGRHHRIRAQVFGLLGRIHPRVGIAEPVDRLV